jgi:hypothetical protein
MTSTSASDQIVDLAAVEAMAERWCGSVDPAVLLGADAADGAERLAVVIRRYQAVQLLLAQRAEACNQYAARAHSGPDWLATVNGTSKAEAARALETAKRLDDCPATRAAFAAGEISCDEADAVSGAAKADPTSERRLLEGAKARHDLRETRHAADKVRRAARSAEDEAARHARLHKSRGLRISESPEGHVTIRGQFTPAAFAGVKPILDAHMKARVERARRDGTRDGWDAYRADSFLDAIASGTTTPTARSAATGVPSELATTSKVAQRTLDAEPVPDQARLFAPGDVLAQAEGLDPKINWNLVILVDGIALKRGWAAPGETCEIPGIGRIPVPWINQLLPEIHTEMLIHDSVDIRAYATRTRHRTRPVELAVRVRDRDCTVPRCHRDISELDHITDYADTHDTSVVNVHGMCSANHDDKTYRDATFQRDDTNWRWWPPGTDTTTTPPMTAPIGAHLTLWNLDHLPADPADDPDSPPKHG